MKEKQASTEVVRGTVTVQQVKAIDSLIGSVGSNRQDVVGKIITIWLYNEGIIKEIRQKKKNV